jgi:hypothetical protein
MSAQRDQPMKINEIDIFMNARYNPLQGYGRISAISDNVGSL